MFDIISDKITKASKSERGIHFSLTLSKYKIQKFIETIKKILK